MAREDREVRLSPMRRTIAERMCSSLNQTAQYTLTREIEIDGMLTYINEQKAAGKGYKFMHVLIKVCATLLQEHEKLNATIVEKLLHYYGAVNMGVAVAVKEGLVVPVIKGVDDMSVDQIVEAYSAIVPKAKSGKLTIEDMSGGTFTISNLGMAGIDAFTPVVNYPEAAILGVGRTNERVVFGADDKLERRKTVIFSLTLDHRIVDGYVGAMFLESLAQTLGDQEKTRTAVE